MPAHSSLLNPDSATSVALLQDCLRNALTGGPFPEEANLEGIKRILDLGCGPGAWAVDVARQFPHTEVTGIDDREMMLAYATELTHLHRLTNLHFEPMEVRCSLRFADDTFDLVHLCAVPDVLSTQSWPRLLHLVRQVPALTGCFSTWRWWRCYEV